MTTIHSLKYFTFLLSSHRMHNFTCHLKIHSQFSIPQINNLLQLPYLAAYEKRTFILFNKFHDLELREKESNGD